MKQILDNIKSIVGKQKFKNLLKSIENIEIPLDKQSLNFRTKQEIYKDFSHFTWFNSDSLDTLFLVKPMLMENGYTLYRFCSEYTADRYYAKTQYSTHPGAIRQDNKTYINRGGSSHTNRNSIRYPKLCRKTAWKRFYKLFPYLNPLKNTK